MRLARSTAAFAVSVVSAAILASCSQPIDSEAPAAQGNEETRQIAAPDYPATRTVDQVDVYQSAAQGEVTVADP